MVVKHHEDREYLSLGSRLSLLKRLYFFSIVDIIIIQREGPQMRGGIVIKRWACSGICVLFTVIFTKIIQRIEPQYM